MIVALVEEPWVRVVLLAVIATLLKGKRYVVFTDAYEAEYEDPIYIFITSPQARLDQKVKSAHREIKCTRVQEYTQRKMGK